MFETNATASTSNKALVSRERMVDVELVDRERTAERLKAIWRRISPASPSLTRLLQLPLERTWLNWTTAVPIKPGLPSLES